MKKLIAILALLTSCSIASADTAYGTLNNFDVVNDTGQTCYGFLIELDDVRSTDITYTYDWNHYGTPRLAEDVSDPAHPKVFIWHEAKRNPDGTFTAFTNPLDPAHPIGPTSGHDCTNPSVNYGCEHFGVGLYGAPSLVKYNWLVENPVQPGTLMVGPAVTISAPTFVYYPPVPPPINVGDPPAAPARVEAVIEPPEPPEPLPGQWGVPVWVKVLKTVQPSGVRLELDELVSDDDTDPNDVNWDGAEEAETEVEWMVFQKRPPGDPAEDEFKAGDDLPDGDEMVTRRYEFYVYNGPVNAEDGEALCDNTNNCPDAVGAYIGSQMAGFNAEAPLGLIDHLQDGEVLVPYVDRTTIVGGNTPFIVMLTGALPDGMALDPLTGVLSGTPNVAGTFNFTVDVTDSQGTNVAREFSLRILATLEITSAALPPATEDTDYTVSLVGAGGVAPYFWAADSLPSGLNITEAGVLSGRPALGTAGDYVVGFSLSDANGKGTSRDLVLAVQAAPPMRGDLNGDRIVDLNDLSIILAARNKPASGPNDPRDLDHDGRITVLDARILATLFTSAP